MDSFAYQVHIIATLIDKVIFACTQFFYCSCEKTLNTIKLPDIALKLTLITTLVFSSSLCLPQY
jgi:hypothetical protein